jgi:hypothetical protein
MRMWYNRTESTKHWIGAEPDFKQSVHDEGEFGEGWNVAVVEPKVSKQLPDTLNGIELRAASREEKQREVGLMREAPSDMGRSMVVFGGVDDDEDTPACSGAGSSQVAQKRPTGLGIEVARGWKRAQLAVTHSDGSEIANALAGRRRDAHRIPDFRRNPHSTAATLADVLGDESIDKFIGRQYWLKAGVKIALNSAHMLGLDPDASLNPYYPFLAVQTAAKRRTEGGQVFGADQCVSREQALRKVTAAAAWMSFDEKRKGSLEVGKMAALAILTGDLFECPDDRIREPRSRVTVVGGKIVYERCAAQ